MIAIHGSHGSHGSRGCWPISVLFPLVQAWEQTAESSCLFRLPRLTRRGPSAVVRNAHPLTLATREGETHNTLCSCLLPGMHSVPVFYNGTHLQLGPCPKARRVPQTSRSPSNGTDTPWFIEVPKPSAVVIKRTREASHSCSYSVQPTDCVCRGGGGGLWRCKPTSASGTVITQQPAAPT